MRVTVRTNTVMSCCFFVEKPFVVVAVRRFLVLEIALFARHRVRRIVVVICVLVYGLMLVLYRAIADLLAGTAMCVAVECPVVPLRGVRIGQLACSVTFTLTDMLSVGIIEAAPLDFVLIGKVAALLLAMTDVLCVFRSESAPIRPVFRRIRAFLALADMFAVLVLLPLERMFYVIARCVTALCRTDMMVTVFSGAVPLRIPIMFFLERAVAFFARS